MTESVSWFAAEVDAIRTLLEENGVAPLQAIQAARNMITDRAIVVGEGSSEPVPADGRWHLTKFLPAPEAPSVVESLRSPPIPRPPQWIEKVLYLILRKRDREEILGDLYEEYPDIVAKFGPAFARKWAVAQLVQSIRPLTRSRIVNLFFGWLLGRATT